MPKSKERKLDTTVSGDPNGQLLKDLEQWDAAVIGDAQYFTWCKMHGPSRNFRHVIVFRALPEAITYAKHDEQSLVYAITKEGRSCVILRSQYADAMTIWNKLHPLDLNPHVFRAYEGGWFAYCAEHTTGPWPDEMQAALVSSALSHLRPVAWSKLNFGERVATRRLLETLNVKLVDQGRVPIWAPGDE